MMLTTAFNIIGYIGAPLALGVLDKKRRIFYATVFIMLGLLLSTLNLTDFIVSNSVITVMIFLYAIIKIKNGEYFNFKSLYFIAYLWAIMVFSSYSVAVISLSIIFYLYMTSKSFTKKSIKNITISSQTMREILS